MALILLQSSLVSAQNFQRYVPPSDSRSDRSSQQRTTSVSRGCSRASAELTLLIPYDHVAVTASAHPTFLLYLSEIPSHPLRISITERQTPEPILDQTLTVKHSGVVAIKVPQSTPALLNEKTYVLTAGILCNPARPSQSDYTRIAFKKIPLSFSVQQQLATASNELERAQIFARAGIWYDAIASSYEAYFSKISGASHYFQSLMAQVELSIVREPTERTSWQTDFQQ